MAKNKISKMAAETGLKQAVDLIRSQIQSGIREGAYTLEDVAAGTDISIWKLRTCVYGNGGFSAKDMKAIAKFIGKFDRDAVAPRDKPGQKKAEPEPEDADKEPADAEPADAPSAGTDGVDPDSPADPAAEHKDPCPVGDVLSEEDALCVIRPILHILPEEKKAAAVRAVMRVYLGTEKEE